MSKILFSAEDVRADLQQTARALHENDLLGAYYTTFALAQAGTTIRAAEAIDRRLGLRLAVQLRRRAITEFPSRLVKLFPWWEIPRTILSRANLGQGLDDALLFRSITSFDRHVARRLNGYAAVYAGNGAARASFRAAKESGALCIYGVRSFDPRFEDSLKKKEFEKFPRLRPNDAQLYKNWRLVKIQQEEWELADLMIMHSNICRDSYAAYGLDTRRVRVIPLGFPEIGPPIPVNGEERSHTLNILWAGNFSVLKGAHYFIRALEAILRSTNVEVRVFGKQMLPEHRLSDSKLPIVFRPTIPRAELFREYRWADVVVHPTLADGYGMVVAEAMSQGLAVITTECAGVSEQIQSGKTGLVIPAGDDGALARALCWCAENREELRAMGLRARETAVSWQWSHYRKGVAAAITELFHSRLIPR